MIPNHKFKIGDIVILDYYTEDWKIKNIKYDFKNKIIKYIIQLVSPENISGLKNGEIFDDISEDCLRLKKGK